MLAVPEGLCVPLLTVTPPNAAAADILLTPSPPKKIDRRATAAGQNHPARRRRNTDVGAGLYYELSTDVLVKKLENRSVFGEDINKSLWLVFNFITL